MARRGAGLLLPAVALALGACAPGGGPAASTAQQVSATKLPGDPKAASAVMAAVDGTAGGSAAVTLTMSGAQLLGNGDATAAGSFDFSAPKGSMQVQLASGIGSESLVYTPGSVYIEQPGKSQSGKPWGVYSAVDAGSTAIPPQISQAEQISPAFLISELDAGAVSAAHEGSDTVGGAAVTRYQVAVDAWRALQHLQNDGEVLEAAAVRAQGLLLFGAAPGSSSPPLLMDVDVDPSGRLVRVAVDQSRGGLGVDVLTLSSPGVAVSVVTPSPAQTFDEAVTGPGGEGEKTPGKDGDAS